MPHTHSYGYIPDIEDNRDFLFKVKQPLKQIALPSYADLRPFCSPVHNQGDLGSCTGFATAVGFAEFVEKKGAVNYVELSPMFVYYQARVYEGTVLFDSGATMRNAMKVLYKKGVSPEIDYPYNPDRFTKRPSCTAYRHAKPYKISNYYRLLDLQDMKECLAGGLGFTLGFSVFESFESDKTATTGIMDVPQPDERLLGGHAVFVAGYSDDSNWAGGGYLIIKNSWGEEWGDKGYFYMPYKVVENINFVSDAWVGVL